jgi:hypothetical protein
LAADQTFEWHRPKRKDDWEQVWQPKSEAWPPYEPDFPDREEPKYELDDGPLTDTQLEKVKEQSGVDDNTDMQKFFDDGKKLAQAIDANDGHIPVLEGEETQAQRLIDEAETKNKTLSRELEAVKATAENLKKKFVNWIKDPLKKKS